MNKKDLAPLEKSLLFLHVKELKSSAEKLGIAVAGNKGAMIEAIVHYVRTGKELPGLQIPKNSCALRGQVYKLSADARMLKGAYKNDLKTRLFFKSLIGEHFHFTAFGVDWIEECWLKGLPPTYQEFATMWQAEYERRKKVPATPKKEWAYINFVKALLKEQPTASSFYSKSLG